MEQHTEPKQDQETERFGDAMEGFGEQMATWSEAFGEQMAAWGEEFGRHMEVWGREFERRMEAWGKEFGPRMEAWTEDLAQGVEKVGKRIGEWFEEETATSAADAQNLRDERLAILRMVEQGKITVSEAEKLLQALGR